MNVNMTKTFSRNVYKLFVVDICNYKKINISTKILNFRTKKNMTVLLLDDPLILDDGIKISKIRYLYHE